MAASIGAAVVMPGSTAKLPPAAPANTSNEPPGPAMNSYACKLPPPASDTWAAASPAPAPATVSVGASRSMRLSGGALRTSSGRCNTQVLPPSVVLPQGVVLPSPDTLLTLPAASVSASLACRLSWPCGARSTPVCVRLPAFNTSAPPADSGEPGRPAPAPFGRDSCRRALPTSMVKRLSLLG